MLSAPVNMGVKSSTPTHWLSYGTDSLYVQLKLKICA